MSHGSFNYGNYGNYGSSGNFGNLRPCVRSRPNFDRGSNRYHTPDLLDFRIGYGNAAIGPICLPVQGSEKCEAGRQPMNHDVAARTHSQLSRSLSILRLGIRDVQRKMKLAVRAFGVDQVIAFRSFMVSLFLFCADRDSSKGDAVRLEYLSAPHQGHGPL